MTFFELLSILFQIVLPLALIARVGLARRRSQTLFALDGLGATTYLGAIALAAPWLAVPRGLIPAFLVLLAIAVVARARRASAAVAATPRPRRVLAAGGLAVRILLVLLSAGIAIGAVLGRQPIAGDPIELAFPLRGGTYLVASGGSNIIVNPHLETLEGERARPFRGQSYAVDIVRAGGWGSRTAGVSPDGPEGFAIFGDSIHAPCAGVAVRAADGQPDRLAPGEERASLEGNHVILECGGAWILLAHMRRGSVAVRAGDSIPLGQVVGRVGNSGASDEPHLHIHAQRPGSPDVPLGGAPLPITFDGRHLVRNQRVRVMAAGG